jgi:hypothetical protein
MIQLSLTGHECAALSVATARTPTGSSYGRSAQDAADSAGPAHEFDRCRGCGPRAALPRSAAPRTWASRRSHTAVRRRLRRAVQAAARDRPRCSGATTPLETPRWSLASAGRARRAAPSGKPGAEAARRARDRCLRLDDAGGQRRARIRGERAQRHEVGARGRRVDRAELGVAILERPTIERGGGRLAPAPAGTVTLRWVNALRAADRPVSDTRRVNLAFARAETYGWNDETRAYRLGNCASAQPLPQLTTPASLATPATFTVSGPPLSPWHESLPPPLSTPAASWSQGTRRAADSLPGDGS